MNLPRWMQSAALLAAGSLALSAQQAPSGFHTVACIKVKPDKSGEYRKWTSEVLHKFAQGRVDSGALSTFYLLRTVFPAGASAECDYLTVAIYPGAPPEPLGMEDASVALKKAGLNMSAEEYMASRDALSTLVSSSLFKTEAFAGAARKGAYMMVNYMKASNYDKWLDFEKKFGKALAEQAIGDGLMSGWSANGLWLPYGSDLPYQGVTVDVYPNWDAVFKEDPNFMDRFKKAHPDLVTSPEEMEKIRTQAVIRLFKVEDMISTAK